MRLDDPFPIETFRRNVRDTILTEFGGRCPSIREVFSIPDAAWMAMPGIGPVTLAELRHVMQSGPVKAKARLFAGWSDAELEAERDRLRNEVVGIRNHLISRRHKLMAITAELRRRETLAQDCDDRGESSESSPTPSPESVS